MRILEAALLERNSTHSISTRKSNNSKRSNSSHKSGKLTLFLQLRSGLEIDIPTLKTAIALSQERQPIEKQSRKTLDDVERRKIEVFKEEERALLSRVPKTLGQFQVKVIP